MRLLVYLCLIIAMFILGCTTSSIRREGYSIDGAKPTSSECKIPVKFQYDLSKGKNKTLGIIEASEPGMGIQCQEDFVLEQFQKDACAIGANLINITDEKFPNFWSSCYRAKAQLVLLDTSETLKSDAKYSLDEVADNSKRGHARTKTMIQATGAAAAGVVGGAAAASATPESPK